MTSHKIAARRETSVKRLPLVPSWKTKCLPLEPIAFSYAYESAKNFAKHIELNFEAITRILLEYESYEVVLDETNRTLDLLKNLDENKKYFFLRIGGVTSFLPRNQPLYALACFVIVPSLMAAEVHFRIPHSMKHFFRRLLDTLDVKIFFPNVIVSAKERLDFLEERSALRIDSITGESLPVTDAVIFTGTPHHAERLRFVFDRRTLFISNGAGHNPVVVSQGADISKAVEAVSILQLYNQGQDCAAPNSILVHHKVYFEFLNLLRENVKKIKVGFYSDRFCRVGPISESDDLNRIQAIFVENKRWLDPSTPGIIRTKEAIVEPTIICRPLQEGGNFTEVFAPIFFIQEYRSDSQLSQYFESNQYKRNAMYISLFGESDYVSGLADRLFSGQVLHNTFSILHNTHLHAAGVERGTQPYGGYGYGASSISIHGKIITKPTLPPREIYNYLVKPMLKINKIRERRNLIKKAKVILKKDVHKLLGIKPTTASINTTQTIQSPILYVDSKEIQSREKRYFSFHREKAFSLLSEPNLAHAILMDVKYLHQVRILRKYLRCNKVIKLDRLTSFLYTVGKKGSSARKENKSQQLVFFKHLYQLLFGQDFGPRLATFILEAEKKKVIALLDVDEN